MFQKLRMNDENFNVLVLSRGGILYKGAVKSITSVNDQGRFDVLPHHANFISLIKDILIIRELSGNVKEIKIGDGILRVTEKAVEVYLGVEGEKNKAS